MYNTLENDTGRRINFTARSHNTGTHRRSDILVEISKGRRAFQGENSKYLHRNKRVYHILSASNLEWDYGEKNKR